MVKRTVGALVVLGGLLGVMQAQEMAPTAKPRTPQQTQLNDKVEPMQTTPTFRVNVVAHTTRAVNYRNRAGATKIDFQGTDLMPEAHGQAKVESKKGYYEIEVQFNKMRRASTFGNEYLTYVFWAITPDGNPKNLGEVIPNENGDVKLDVTTELQSFGLIVTAEPYFAVGQPSNTVVMENFIRTDTKGAYQWVDAKYELLERGQYARNMDRSMIQPIAVDPNVPLEFYEAQNAIQIAKWSGADRYASDVFQKAQASYVKAQQYRMQKGVGNKPVVMMSREAVQVAEDARVLSIRRQGEENLAAERQSAADREAAAKAQAEDEARRRTQAEADQRAEADKRMKAEADLSAAERMKREAEEASARAKLQQEEAEKASAAARAEAEQAQQGRLAAERDKEELRAKLLEQFNRILQTEDTARGLVVNMSDVLFDTGQATLRASAREKLAKISGILLAYPGLTVGVEGHTDSVGGDAYNQTLSEKRAAAVQKYLVAQSVPSDAVTAKGFGKTQPKVSNNTAAGRQQNRRVELVVAGEVIGTKLGSKTQGQGMPLQTSPTGMSNLPKAPSQNYTPKN